ncbi:alpha/beta fold hydrolase [Mycobacteroides immunogenum]|uniref:Hydrolase n=1 Tax=Mycobacteroides immunogenum TaxID=83262 RepID=A0A7V8LR84_9MYCO|nr:alpha/beta hydrolase [Mycobacteroides immunogenum]AMT72083.1 hydrolase [Mycobacteroides immunogenum]ANO05212.1 hydrolase [Mycobacteroides immunogenum]KIU40121.1 hydrolase [Mycobacteroides immunogenum]KPG13616.1 hydrolase [Mycobacteroides immunogenum]KPG14463.1 hydrolase [Mycobacteroides immunogenum]
MPNIDVNGQSIHYTDNGADGPVILATHATLMDVVSLDKLTKRLPGRVIAFDLRGHGQTVYDRQPYDYLDVAQDALGLMDQLGVEHFTFLGEGQGAVVALRTALAAPERVDRLILIGPTADAASDSENAALDASMDVWCTLGPDPEVYHLVAQYATGGSPEDAADLLRRWQSSAWRDYRPAATALATRPRFVDQLHEITCPTLIVHGTGDFYVSIDFGREVSENLGGPTEFVELPTERQAITVAFDPRVGDAVLSWLGDR